MSNKKIALLVLICCCLNLANSWQYHRRQIVDQQNINPSSQQEYNFEQIVNHYNYQSSQTWSQRYFVYKDYFNPQKGPVFLYICGQAECKGISNISWVAKMAEQTEGLVLSLEHRYYGKSLPFGQKSFQLENLVYLTSDQALKDLAYFITQMKTKKMHSVGDNPWITVGGSYPGAMAAWFRSKYPHMTVGSISSSGVILAVENFRMFDQQIYTSLMKSGNFCVQSIRNVNDYVQGQITGPNKVQFQAQFNASKLTGRQFMFYWTDSIIFQIQYGKRESFCNSIKDKTIQEAYGIMKELVKKVNCSDYGAFYLSNDTFDKNSTGARSWIYQSCTEFSYFQTYSMDHPMRSRLLSLSFYQKWCQDIFGKGRWPYTERRNIQYGGLSIQADNLIMTNGDQDPWQWASLQHSTLKSIYSKVINCNNCAHCVDLHAPDAKHDAKDLTETRSYELQSVKSWISNYWKNFKEQ